MAEDGVFRGPIAVRRLGAKGRGLVTTREVAEGEHLCTDPCVMITDQDCIKLEYTSLHGHYFAHPLSRGGLHCLGADQPDQSQPGAQLPAGVDRPCRGGLDRAPLRPAPHPGRRGAHHRLCLRPLVRADRERDLVAPPPACPGAGRSATMPWPCCTGVSRWSGWQPWASAPWRPRARCCSASASTRPSCPGSAPCRNGLRVPPAMHRGPPCCSHLWPAA